MKHSWMIQISTVFLTAMALSACGHSGGSNNNTSGFSCDAYGNCSASPSAYIANGSWSGTIGIITTAYPQYQQFAAMAGMGTGYGYATSSLNLSVTLQSGGGYGYSAYPGYTGAVQTTAQIRLISNGGGQFSSSNAQVTGDRGSFQLLAPLTGGYYTQPYYPGQPNTQQIGNVYQRLQVNGQWTDATQNAMNVQVYYAGVEIAYGTIYSSGYGSGAYNPYGGVSYVPGYSTGYTTTPYFYNYSPFYTFSAGR